jgi:predicted nuclease of predicted toxin-antitoxin system
MRFLLDQDVYAATRQFLLSLGHDVVQVSQLGLSQATDEQLLAAAQEQGRILITRDRDFGTLVFARALGSGVLYLRMLSFYRASRPCRACESPDVLFGEGTQEGFRCH